MTDERLADCAERLRRVIGDVSMNMRDVALAYRDMLVAQPNGLSWDGWRGVNEAILARWGASGLRRVKHLAWGKA